MRTLAQRDPSAASRPDAPIGVFDSGVGGLSILKALRQELPHEDFVYLADDGYAPYGERPSAFVRERAHRLTEALLNVAGGLKALVVACNTATAAAIGSLRDGHPELPIVGVEPALKPAVTLSRTQRIGVMATRGTLASAKFAQLLGSLQAQAHFVCQPCDGLADAIERDDAPLIEALCARYISAMGPFGTQSDNMDTLVLGCTHYPFAQPVLQELVGPEVTLVSTGVPVALQTRRRLQRLQPDSHSGGLRCYATGHGTALQAALRRWLMLDTPVEPLAPWAPCRGSG
ncbi:MAG: glutamate racemase [Rhodoferax sp.]